MTPKNLFLNCIFVSFGLMVNGSILVFPPKKKSRINLAESPLVLSQDSETVTAQMG